MPSLTDIVALISEGVALLESALQGVSEPDRVAKLKQAIADMKASFKAADAAAAAKVGPLE